jgi:hypothetical protein
MLAHCWVNKRPGHRNVDSAFEARIAEGIFVGRATSDKTCASVVHIPSKGTTSRAFVMTNNVAFWNRYPVANKSELSSGCVLDFLPQGMDVSDQAQMMPNRFAGINILKGYTHCISSLGRLRWPGRCKEMQQNIVNKKQFNTGPHAYLSTSIVVEEYEEL